MSTSCRCGATWTGHRIEHCTACHQTFTGTSSGDRHRTGDHAISEGPDRRRCLTVDEMLAKGLTRNERGHWTNGQAMPAAALAQIRAARVPESDEQGSPGTGSRPDPARPANQPTAIPEDAA